MNNNVFKYAYATVMILCSVWVIVKAHVQQSGTERQHQLADEFNHGCITNFDLQGQAVRPLGGDGAGKNAVRAREGLLDLEHDYYEIHSDCVNRLPQKKQGTLPLRYVVLDSSGWSRSKLLEASRHANAVLGQCGIHFEDIKVTVVAVDSNYNRVDITEYFQLINSSRYSLEATLYFLNDQAITDKQLWGQAMLEGKSAWYDYYPEKLKEIADINKLARPGILDNIALIVGNHSKRGQRDYHWRTLGLGKTIAHELYHILGNCECHEKRDKQNFMYPGGGHKATKITPAQCKKSHEGISRIRALENTRIMTYEEP